MKAGLLLPRSNAYPGIAGELTVAMRLCLKQYGNEDVVSFVSENIGFGDDEKDIYQKAEKLLYNENADILIAYMDLKMMPVLEPLIEASGKFLVVLNTGANYPSRKAPQPGIIYLTLQHAFLCALTGKAAGNSPGIYATTFYDCGYMHGAAMNTYFEKNNGTVIFNYVCRELYDDSFNINALTDFLTARPEKKINLLCIFDETPAALFYKKLNEYEHADRLSLFVSPMMLTKKALAGGEYRFPIQGYSSWLPQADNGENNKFIDMYNEVFQKDPTLFSVSGWQAGMLLNEFLKATDQSPKELIRFTGEKSLSSPAGTLSLDTLTNFFMTDKIYCCSLPAGANGLIISTEKTGKADWDDYVNSQNDLPSSGWTNTYLCY